MGQGRTSSPRILRLLFLVAAAAILCFLAVLPLNWPQQAVLGLLSLVVALVMARSSDSYLVTLTLMMLSMFCTFRYGYWRIDAGHAVSSTTRPITGARSTFSSSFACFSLRPMPSSFSFSATFKPSGRCAAPRSPCPRIPTNGRDIDVLIPTYNEPLDVVRYTALGALNMDWPADKLHVYILDDGRRKEFEQFAFEAGIGYRTRPDNRYAKAGNINAALKSHLARRSSPSSIPITSPRAVFCR